MPRLLLLLSALIMSVLADAQSTNFAFSSSSYITTTDFIGPCTKGPCANYNTSMRVTGALNVPPTGIGDSSMYPFSFFDGINTYASGDPNLRVTYYQAYTLVSSGDIGQYDIQLLLWQTGTSPHVSGDRYALLILSGRQATVINNQVCGSPGFVVNPTKLTYDACSNQGFLTDGLQSGATTGMNGTAAWTRTVLPPTPASVSVSSGSGQSALVGTTFSQPLVVLVKDFNGNPYPNAQVSWTKPGTGPSATLSNFSTFTNASGIASIDATANATDGSYIVTASVGTLATNFTLTNTAGTSADCADESATNDAVIEQYYNAILRRPSDAGGKAFWMSEASRLCGLGTDPKETFFLLANVFFNSPEYLALGRSDNEFATDLYVTFFNRAPDVAGLTYWTGQLFLGMPRNIVMNSFLFSPEFTATMNGLFPGSTARAETYLVLNLYGGFFRRLADSPGYLNWDAQFRAAECSVSPASSITATISTVSSQFIASPEYVGRAATNNQYVQDLYYALLQRGGDAGGFNYWVNQLDSGSQSRDQVRQAFLQSPEMLAQSAAIAAQGCLP